MFSKIHVLENFHFVVMKLTMHRLDYVLLGSVFGAGICALAIYIVDHFRKSDNCPPKDKSDSDDTCMSLFYHHEVPSDGSGFPNLNTILDTTVARLTMIHEEYRRLPSEFYAKAVECLPIVCVDVICRRNDGKVLLFLRRDKPASNIWWWPGGRMFRGETFFQAAIRKITDETGCDESQIHPISLLQTWNTFFPDSHWDSHRKLGYEGTQTVNIVVLVQYTGEHNLTINSKNKSKWAVNDYKWVHPNEIMNPTSHLYDKYVTLNVKYAQKLKLL